MIYVKCRKADEELVWLRIGRILEDLHPGGDLSQEWSVWKGRGRFCRLWRWANTHENSGFVENEARFWTNAFSEDYVGPEDEGNIRGRSR
jgi:hypothetical protein